MNTSNLVCFFTYFFILHCHAQKNDNLTYGNPIEVGLDSVYMHHKVDSIMAFAIKNNAFPGAQLLVAKKNKIIFHKAYGFHTYNKIKDVTLTDVYDLASVTKIIGPLPALIKFHGEGKLDLDKPFSNYWHSWQSKKDKKDLTLRQILAHQAGLMPYITFLNDVIKNGKVKKRFIRTKSSRRFRNQISEHLFIKNSFYKKMHRKIARSKVSKEKKYRYSGLSFLIYPNLISKMSNRSYPDYLQQTFYKPLGANTLGFLPKNRSFSNQVVPTEKDTLFRKTIIKAWVHDENAALLGGISGNAGLFGTATDLAKVMQMYMQYGTYGGKRYLQEASVKEFTRVQYIQNENRRGLGFDKPLLNNSTLALSKAYPAPEASAASFGHSGFTGTFVWADPESELVFIFLSNRVYPSRTNRNLYNLNIRPALHQVFYKAEIPLAK